MRVMISCGEPSGDVYAGALTAALREQDPGVDVFGFGGQHLAAAGGRLIGDFRGFSVTGLTEALRVVPRSFAMLRQLVDAARAQRPDVFVAIDFPDFNFQLMARLHRLGIPIVYYISPQLWAWRSGRMKTMRKFVDRVLVIFPFEAEVYRQAGVPVEFVGHPLVEMMPTTTPRDEFLAAVGLSPSKPTVALLPGSRHNELQRIVPTLAEALPIVRAQIPDVQFVVACAPNLPEPMFAPLLAAGERSGARVTLVHQHTDDVLASCDAVITASGTATVQCALHEAPMVVVYRLSPLTYRLGKPLVRVDTYAMPNLIAGERIVPELIQEGFTAERTAGEIVSLLTDAGRHAQMRRDLRRVRERLGEPGASRRAAQAVLAAARRPRPSL